MKIYGDVDRMKDGKIRSHFPAWYYEQQIEDLKESIRHREYQLDNDLIASTERNIQRERLKQEKDKLDKIEFSRVKLTPIEKDEMGKFQKEMGTKIKNQMFSRSEMEKGTADAHEEARRMIEPIIEIKGEFDAKLAEECGVKVKDGKISRKDAEKMWKIASRALGEPSNTETLRKG